MNEKQFLEEDEDNFILWSFLWSQIHFLSLCTFKVNSFEAQFMHQSPDIVLHQAFSS